MKEGSRKEDSQASVANTSNICRMHFFQLSNYFPDPDLSQSPF